MRIRSWFLLGAAALTVAHIPYLIAPPEGPMLFWREALTAMVSHNLAAGDGTLLRQTVDHFNPVNRVFAGEFPAYNVLLALAEKGFGPAHNYGRYVSFASYLVGLTAFFAYLRSAGRPQREVVLATLVLAFSSWYTHSTRIMPDMFATCTMMVGVWAGGRYLLGRGELNLVPFVLAVMIASLSKLPMLMVLGLLFPVWLGAPRRSQLVLMAAGAGAVLPALGWYFYWIPQLKEAGAHVLMFPTELTEGFRQVFIEYWKDTKAQFSIHAFSGCTLAVAAAIRLILICWRKNRFWAWSLLASIPFLVVLIGQAGITFATHYYYMIHVVPLLSSIAALPLAAIPPPFRLFLFLLAHSNQLSI